MADIVVTTGSTDPDRGLTLAEAFELANASGEADTIRFAEGVGAVLLAETLVARPEGGALTVDGDRDGDGITDVALQAGGFAHLFVQSGVEAVIRNVDFLGGRDQRNFFVAEGGTSGSNREGTRAEATGGIDGGDAGPGTPGGEGDAGFDGASAAAAIRNFGTLTLERVGFGGGQANGQSGGDGGSGGFGGFSRGGDGLEDTDRDDTPGPTIFGGFATWEARTNGTTEPFAGAGGAGGSGGDGGTGGTGGAGGTGSAVLNLEGATLTLIDTVFGGRLPSGTLAEAGRYSGGWGGTGGLGGAGGDSFGGRGADGGKEWAAFEIYEFFREDGTVNDRHAFIRVATTDGAQGGDAAEGGDGGTGGTGGAAGSAGLVVNLGSIDGQFAGTLDAGGASAGRAGAGGEGGVGGEAIAGLGGFDRLPYYVKHLSSAIGRNLMTPEHQAYLDLIVELGSTQDRLGDRADPGLAGPEGALGGIGAAGRDGTVAALVNDGSGDAAVASSLVYLHGGGGVAEGGTLSVSLVRVGDVSEASTVTWQVVPDDTDAADFGGTLPRGTVRFDAVGAADGVDASNAARIEIGIAADGLDEAREDWRIEIVSATGDTALGTASIDAWIEASGGAPGPVVQVGTPGADRFAGTDADETYRFDDRGDRVTEAAGGGTDTILARASVTLGGAEIERVVLEGSAALRVTGNAAATAIEGNAGSNILVGGGGGDVLTGGGGADFFAFLTTDAPGAARITDFGEADRIALDDRFFGLGDGSIDVRDVTGQQVSNAVRNGAAGFDGRNGELWVDMDGARGPGERMAIAVLEDVARIGADDLLLF